jgi:hypothetical protein
MSPRFVRWFALAALLGVAPSALAQETVYFPLKIGSRWEYKSAQAQIVIEIKTTEKVGGVECTKLEASVGDKVVATESVAATKDGVYRYLAQGQQPKPPVRFIKLPPKDGDKFNIDSDMGGKKIKGTFTTSTGEVTVPAGKFNCIIVKTEDMEAAGQKIKSTCWYAENVGMVKQVVEIMGETITLELEKYKIGGK